MGGFVGKQPWWRGQQLWYALHQVVVEGGFASRLPTEESPLDYDYDNDDENYAMMIVVADKWWQHWLNLDAEEDDFEGGKFQWEGW